MTTEAVQETSQDDKMYVEASSEGILEQEDPNDAGDDDDDQVGDDKAQSAVPGAKTRKRAITRKRYSKTMVAAMLDIVDELAPQTNRDWEVVAVRFNEKFQDNRDYISVRKKFQDLALKGSVPALQTRENIRADEINRRIQKVPQGFATGASTMSPPTALPASFAPAAVMPMTKAPAVMPASSSNGATQNKRRKGPDGQPLGNGEGDAEEDDASSVQTGVSASPATLPNSSSFSTLSAALPSSSSSSLPAGLLPKDVPISSFLPKKDGPGLSSILYQILHTPMTTTRKPTPTPPPTQASSSSRSTPALPACLGEGGSSTGSEQANAADDGSLSGQNSQEDAKPADDNTESRAESKKRSRPVEAPEDEEEEGDAEFWAG